MQPDTVAALMIFLLQLYAMSMKDIKLQSSKRGQIICVKRYIFTNPITHILCNVFI